MSQSHPERVMELELLADPSVVHAARERFAEFVRPARMSRDDIEAIKVALSEAVTNAVCHGSPSGVEDQVTIRCVLQPDRLVIEVSDQGPGFSQGAITLPHLEEMKPSGRGLFLMQALMDEIQFERTTTGTRVRLVKMLLRCGLEGTLDPARDAHSGRNGGSPHPAAWELAPA